MQSARGGHLLGQPLPILDHPQAWRQRLEEPPRPLGRGQPGDRGLHDPPGLDVVRVAVATVHVVRHHDVRTPFAQVCRHQACGLGHVGPGEGARVVGGRHTGHARVAPPRTGPVISEEGMPRTQASHRAGQLARAELSEGVVPVGRAMPHIGRDHLALLAEGRGEDLDIVAARDVVSDGDAGGKGLVVGMGVDEEQTGHYRTVRASGK